MGIDVYAKWKNMSAQEEATQLSVWASVEDGRVGYPQFVRLRACAIAHA